MPRSELNNPTERIGRLLAEIEEILQYVSEYEDWIRPHVPTEILITAPSRPVPIEYEKELVRRSLSHHKPYKASSVKNVLANRISQRLSRERKARGYNVRGRKIYGSVTEEEILEAIEKEQIDPAGIAEEILKNTTTTEVEIRPESSGISDPFAKSALDSEQLDRVAIELQKEEAKARDWRNKDV